MGIITATSLGCNEGKFKNVVAWLTAKTQHHCYKCIVIKSLFTSATPVIAHDVGKTQTKRPIPDSGQDQEEFWAEP